ncbi:phospholipase D-like domain-containing protein [Streptomyces albogriseolus]
MISNWPTRDGRSLGSALLLTLSLLLAALCVPSASAATSGCQEEGNYEACFIYGGTEDTLLVSKIRGKVDATARASAAGEAGNYVRVALYDWKADGGGLALASSLVDAARSGVSVRLVIGTAAASVKAELAKADIDITYCADACATPGSGAMHNKFFLIKKGATKLVLQSSSNIGSTQARHAQNMLVVRDDDALFSAYVDYWRRLNAQGWTYDGVTWGTDASRTHDGSNDLSKAYFFPQPGSTRVADVLGNVSACAEGNDRVWLEASLLDSSSYSAGVAAQLNRLESLGCDVRIVVQKGAGRDTLLAKGIASSRVRCDGYSHNKVIVLDAKYAGQWRKAVFVGSYNLTENSATRANDAMLRVVDGWVTNRYVEQFRQLWTNPRACD